MMNITLKQEQGIEHYAAPAIEVVEIEMEQNILQGSGSATTTGEGLDMWNEDW